MGIVDEHTGLEPGQVPESGWQMEHNYSVDDLLKPWRLEALQKYRRAHKLAEEDPLV